VGEFIKKIKNNLAMETIINNILAYSAETILDDLKELANLNNN